MINVVFSPMSFCSYWSRRGFLPLRTTDQLSVRAVAKVYLIFSVSFVRSPEQFYFTALQKKVELTQSKSF